MEKLKKLFVVIKNNKTFAWDTNTLDFVKQLNERGISDRNPAYFYRKLKEPCKLTIIGMDGCEWFIERLK